MTDKSSVYGKNIFQVRKVPLYKNNLRNVKLDVVIASMLLYVPLRNP